jgi:hypothetical protein
MSVGVAPVISSNETVAFVHCPEIRAIVEPIMTMGIGKLLFTIAEVVSEEPFVTVVPLIVRIYVLIFVPAVVVHQRNFVVLIFAIPQTVPLD